MQVHKEDLLELFPKERLVYVTPYCNQDLVEYNPDDIYVLPAITDKSGQPPLSLARAKKEGLRMVRLPLNRYLNWRGRHGGKLPLNQMISIFLDFRITGDWKVAEKHVPKRLMYGARGERERLDWESSTKPSFGLPEIGELMDSRAARDFQTPLSRNGEEKGNPFRLPDETSSK